MAHDGDHRRPRQQRRLLFFHLVLDFKSAISVECDVLNLMVKLRSDQGRGIRVQNLIDRRHHAKPHQFLNYLSSLDAHVTRQVTDGNDFGNLDNALACPGDSNLGFSLLLARKRPLLPWDTPGAKLFFSKLQDILFLDDTLLVTTRLDWFLPLSPLWFCCLAIASRSQTLCLHHWGRSRRAGHRTP